MSAPLLDSAAPVVAGCDAGPEQVGAGCASSTGEENLADAPPQDSSVCTGCAAQAPAGASESKGTPPQTMREFERALRGLGFSRLQAEHVARKGFAGLSAAAVPEPTPDPDESSMQELMAALQRRATALKGNK